jgi:hypothetical protein
VPFWLVPPTAEPLSLTGFPLDKVRALQHTLYRTAKADPGRRFHALWDKVLRRDVLWRAYGNRHHTGATQALAGETECRR